MADETSRLVIAVDSTSAKAATGDLDKLTAASAKTEAATESLNRVSAERRAEMARALAAGEGTLAQQSLWRQSLGGLSDAEKAAAATYREAALEKARAAESAFVTQQKLKSASDAAAAAAAKDAVASNAASAAVKRNTSDSLLLQTVMNKGIRNTAMAEAAETKLHQAYERGAISALELKSALAVLDKQREKDALLASLQGKASGKINARSGVEATRIVGDLATGNIRRAQMSGLALANYSGATAALMTPIGLAATAVAVAVGGVVAAMVAGERETAAYNHALAASGTTGVTTAGQLRDLSNALGAASGSYGDARDIVQALTHAGLASSSMFQTAAQAASDYAVATGTKAADAARTVGELMTGNFGSISKVDQAYQFLTASQLAHIRALDDQGRATDAAREALQLFADKSATAKDQAVSDAGYIEKAWDGVKGAIGGAVNALKGWGAAQSLADQKADILKQINNTATPGEKAALTQHFKPQLDQINQQLAAQGFDQTQAKIKETAEKNAKAADDYLSQFMTPQQIYGAKMEKLAHTRFADLLAPSLTSEDKARIESKYQIGVQQAQDELQRALKKDQPKAAGSKADPLAGLQSMVDSMSVSAMKAEGPVGQFLGTVQKLTTARDAAIKKGADAGQAEKLFAEGIATANQRLHEQETQLQQRNKVAMEQFTAAIQQQMAVQRQQNDLAIASIGMGSQQAQREQQILQIRMQTQQKIFELQQRAQSSIAQINPQAPGAKSQIDNINQTLKQQQDAYQAFGDWQIAEANRVAAGQDAARMDWTNGLKSAYADLLVQSHDFASVAAKEMNDFANGVSDAFVNIVQGGESVKKAFGSVIDTMLSDALRFIANQAVTKFLGLFMHNGQGSSSNALGGLLGSGGSSQSGGTDWGNLAGDVSSWFGNSGSSGASSSGSSGSGFWGGLFGAIFGGGRANGGPVSPYTSYQVNERGTPELLAVGGKTFLMMGAQGGTVTPTKTTRDRGGVTNISVNVLPTMSNRTASQTAQAVAREQQLAMARA